jgi:hypothetical protein
MNTPSEATRGIRVDMTEGKNIPQYVLQKPTNPQVHQQSNYPNPSLCPHSISFATAKTLYR